MLAIDAKSRENKLTGSTRNCASENKRFKIKAKPQQNNGKSQIEVNQNIEAKSNTISKILAIDAKSHENKLTGSTRNYASEKKRFKIKAKQQQNKGKTQFETNLTIEAKINTNS